MDEGVGPVGEVGHVLFVVRLVCLVCLVRLRLLRILRIFRIFRVMRQRDAQDSRSLVGSDGRWGSTFHPRELQLNFHFPKISKLIFYRVCVICLHFSLCSIPGYSRSESTPSIREPSQPRWSTSRCTTFYKGNQPK